MRRRKRRDYVTVFTDMEERKLLYATPRKDAETWERFGKGLQARGRKGEQIEEVSMA